MSDVIDLCIIGAGPAGMAAAVEATRRDLSVTVLDEQPRAGGQIWRDVTRPGAGAEILGADYTKGRALAQRFEESGATHIPEATVWSIERDENAFEISYLTAGGASDLTAKTLLLATGALERPMPIPGWTLPGVMTAGAAQILLKSSGLVAERAVLAGSGPLLYLVAAQMRRAGAPPLALVETQTRSDMLAAMRHLPGALRGSGLMAKGAGLLRELRGIPRYLGAQSLEVLGAARAEGLRFVHGGQTHEIAADHVFLHHGVTPNIQASRALALPHRWNAGQRCFEPVLARDGKAGEGIWIAGDGAGISGADAAVLRGTMVAQSVAKACGVRVALGDERKVQRALSKALAPRAFLDRAYPPFAGALAPDDATILCRCEEITAGDLRATVAQGARGPNQAKSFCRAGMGPCQGRYCGLSATEVLARETSQTPEETGYYRLRWPLKPITLGALAQKEGDATQEQS